MHRLQLSWVGVVLLMGLSPGSWADTTKLATVLWGVNQVTFMAGVSHEARLTVTGPDFAYRDQGKGTLSWRAVEEDGQPLPDGTYRYELREIVTSPEIEALEAERDYKKQMAMKRQLRREGRWPPPRAKTQNEVFKIESGQIIVPKAQEQSEELSDQPKHRH